MVCTGFCMVLQWFIVTCKIVYHYVDFCCCVLPSIERPAGKHEWACEAWPGGSLWSVADFSAGRFDLYSLISIWGFPSIPGTSKWMIINGKAHESGWSQLISSFYGSWYICHFIFLGRKPPASTRTSPRWFSIPRFCEVAVQRVPWLSNWLDWSCSTGCSTDSGASGGDAASQSIWGWGPGWSWFYNERFPQWTFVVDSLSATDFRILSDFQRKENHGCVASGAYRYRKITLPGNPKARSVPKVLQDCVTFQRVSAHLALCIGKQWVWAESSQASGAFLPE